jgi:predicted nuclease of predicted toxin-antitoxin system
MKILIDMNLSPEWVLSLEKGGFEAVHWSKVGDSRATDHTIMEYAAARGYVVFTHDLDFGAILAVTRANAPSVLQIRTQDVDFASRAKIVISVLRQCHIQLEQGALVSLDQATRRVRILPIRA